MVSNYSALRKSNLCLSHAIRASSSSLFRLLVAPLLCDFRRQQRGSNVVSNMSVIHIAEMIPGLPSDLYSIVAVTTAVRCMMRCLGRDLLSFSRGRFRQRCMWCDIIRSGQISRVLQGAWSWQRRWSFPPSQLAQETHRVTNRQICSLLMLWRTVLKVRLKQHSLA
jgi:hypothetical protein